MTTEYTCRTYVNGGGGNHDVTHIIKVNNSEVTNDSHTGVTNWLHNDFSSPASIKLEFWVTITNGFANQQNAYMEIRDSGGTPVETLYLVQNGSNGSYYGKLTYNYTETKKIPKGQNYIEQLYRLDTKNSNILYKSRSR